MICFKVLFSYISITRASNNFLAGACYVVPSNLYLLRQEMILARQICKYQASTCSELLLWK